MMEADTFALVLFVTLLVLAAALETVDAFMDTRCSANRLGNRCVHEQEHPGSHRDHFGNYWN